MSVGALTRSEARAGDREERNRPGGRSAARFLPSFNAEYIAGAIAGIIVLWLVLYPLGWLLWGVFHEGAPGESGAWTIKNFTAVILDPYYWTLVGRSIVVAIGITALATLIGVPLAWVVVKTDAPLKPLIELTAILPFFTSPFLGGLAWIFLGNPTNGLLKLWLGIPINVYTMPGIIWVTGIYMAPYMFLFSAAALRNLDTSYEEAAFMHGAGLWRTLTRVTFPLILPALLSGMSLVLVISMDIFGVAAILGFPARISLLATEVYLNATRIPPDFGRAEVNGLTLVAITSILLYLQRRYLRGRSYTVLGGRGFRSRLFPLGKWTPVVLAACGLYAAIAVVLPWLVLIKSSFQIYPTPRFTAWTLANWASYFQDPDLLDSLIRSLALGIFGATLCVILTAVVAYIVHRGTIPGRALLEQVSAVPTGTPGVVLGLGIVWAYITWPIWGTFLIFLIAYITMFLPYGVRALGANIVQINTELEESARVHGASWLRTFIRIVLPLLRSGISSTWIMLFVVFIREISIAALLTTVGAQLFPVMIFEQWTAGRFNTMSAGAVMLSLIIFAAIAIFRWVFKVQVVPSYR